MSKTMSHTIYFKDLANDWLIQKKITVKKSTYAKYLNTVNKHIIPEMGNLTLDSIDNRKILDFVNYKLNPSPQKKCYRLSDKTIKDILLVVNSILKYGRRCYPQNVSLIDITYPTIHKKEIRILSQLEQRALEEVLYQKMDNVKLGILISLYTGLRIGEICGLRWEDICTYEGIISIKRTVQRLQTFNSEDNKKTHILIDTPKTSNSVRKIPLPDFLIPIINDYYPDDITSYVLSGKADTCMEPRTLENKYNSYIKQALELCRCNSQYFPQQGKITFHSLRHTFATRCVEYGFEIKCLSEILGHSSVNITLNRYVHSSIQMKRDNMKKLLNTYNAVAL